MTVLLHHCRCREWLQPPCWPQASRFRRGFLMSSPSLSDLVERSQPPHTASA